MAFCGRSRVRVVVDHIRLRFAATVSFLLKIKLLLPLLSSPPPCPCVGFRVLYFLVLHDLVWLNDIISINEVIFSGGQDLFLFFHLPLLEGWRRVCRSSRTPFWCDWWAYIIEVVVVGVQHTAPQNGWRAGCLLIVLPVIGKWGLFAVLPLVWHQWLANGSVYYLSNGWQVGCLLFVRWLPIQPT